MSERMTPEEEKRCALGLKPWPNSFQGRLLEFRKAWREFKLALGEALQCDRVVAALTKALQRRDADWKDESKRWKP